MQNRNLIFLVIAILVVVVLYRGSTNEPEMGSIPQNEVKVADYGAWESPLTAAFIFESADSVSSLSVEGDDLYFIERQSAANGRNILVKLWDNNQVEQKTPSDLSVRTQVHEYGGKSYLVDGEDIYYSKLRDQKIYRLSPNAEPVALTPEGLRYMECVADHNHNQLICVREDHRGEGEAVNTLVGIDMTEGGEGNILFEGTDFVTKPTISPKGANVAFLTWSHPNMNWDDTQLRVLTFSENGGAADVIEVSQNGNVSLRSPKYAKDGTLYFLADWTNWWTLYRLNDEGQPELVLDQDIEMTSYDFEGDSSIVLSYSKGGQAYLARLDLNTGAMQNIGDALSSAGSVTSSSDGVYFTASTPSSRNAIYQLKGNAFEFAYQPSGPSIDEGYLSIPQPVTYPTGDGEEAYGFYYPPTNADYKGPENSLPPLIVKVHGGPVGATRSTLDPRLQFWTSRGFAVFDVNHRGSTGYGREFRKKLYPNWGIVDIEDAAN